MFIYINRIKSELQGIPVEWIFRCFCLKQYYFRHNGLFKRFVSPFFHRLHKIHSKNSPIAMYLRKENHIGFDWDTNQFLFSLAFTGNIDLVSSNSELRWFLVSTFE